MNNSQVVGQVKRGFTSLLQFRGRDRRGQFWPYAVAIFLLSQLASLVLFVPVIFDEILGSLAAADRMAREHPEDWVVQRSSGSVSYQYVGHDPAVLQAMMPDLSAMIWPIIGISVVTIVLLAAAVTRRLHDRGHSGLWALIPVALLTLGLWLFGTVFANITERVATPDGFSSMITPILISTTVNMAYLIALIILVIQLASAGKAEPNRFGPPPEI